MFGDDSFWPPPDVPQWENERNDILASFQEAVVDSLVSKTVRAAGYTEAEAIAVVGGVACNTALRRRMTSAGESLGSARALSVTCSLHRQRRHDRPPRPLSATKFAMSFITTLLFWTLMRVPIWMSRKRVLFARG